MTGPEAMLIKVPPDAGTGGMTQEPEDGRLHSLGWRLQLRQQWTLRLLVTGPREMREGPETPGGALAVSLPASDKTEGSFSGLCPESHKDRRTKLKGNRDREWMCLSMGAPRYRTSIVRGHSGKTDIRPICLRVMEVVNLTLELAQKNLLKSSL